MDNGIKAAVKKFVENRAKILNGAGDVTKADAANLKGIYYFDLKADQPGDVTFKLEDKVPGDAMSGDAYAIVLHYTGNAADEDGITAQPTAGAAAAANTTGTKGAASPKTGDTDGLAILLMLAALSVCAGAAVKAVR